MQHPIGITRNDVEVYIDLVKSKAAPRIAYAPNLLGLAKELCTRLKVTGAEVRIDRNMGRVIGNAYVVETSSKDSILYARRVHDTAFTRFVKNSMPEPSPYLSIILKRDEAGRYELHDIWVGRLNPPGPGSDNETATSKAYWLNHAFVFDGQPIQLRTVTKLCPY